MLRKVEHWEHSYRIFRRKLNWRESGKWRAKRNLGELLSSLNFVLGNSLLFFLSFGILLFKVLHRERRLSFHFLFDSLFYITRLFCLYHKSSIYHMSSNILRMIKHHIKTFCIFNYEKHIFHSGLKLCPCLWEWGEIRSRLNLPIFLRVNDIRDFWRDRNKFTPGWNNAL